MRTDSARISLTIWSVAGLGLPGGERFPGEDGLSGGGGGSVSGGNDICGSPGGIPLAFGVVGNLGQQGDQREPWQLGSRLLPNSEIGAHLREKLHIFEVAAGKALHLREGFPEVAGQTIDHF